MPDRKRSPDILGDLLGQKPAPEKDSQESEASIPVSQDAGIPSSQHTSKPVRQRAGRPARQQASKAAEEEPSGAEQKLKATYYLSPEAMDALEEAWLKLRKMAGQEDRAKVSKSAIVETALLLAVAELEAKREQSQLASKLVGQ